MSRNCIQCLCGVLPSLLLFCSFLKASDRHSWRSPSKWHGAEACARPVCWWQGLLLPCLAGSLLSSSALMPPLITLSAYSLEQRVFDFPWLAKWVLISTLAKETEDVALITMSLSASGRGGGCGHFCMWFQGWCHQMLPDMPLACWAAFLELPFIKNNISAIHWPGEWQYLYSIEITHVLERILRDGKISPGTEMS